VGTCLGARAPPCGDNLSDDLYFTFDDRQVLCGFPIDDYINPVDWDRLQERIDLAVDQRWILNAYAHTPGVSITTETLERAFTMFEAAGSRSSPTATSIPTPHRSPASPSHSTTTPSTAGSRRALCSTATARR